MPRPLFFRAAILAVVLAVLVSACSLVPGTVRTPQAEPSPATASPTSAVTLAPTAAPATAVPTPPPADPATGGLQIRYRLDASVDYDGRSVSVAQSTLLQGLPDGLASLTLVVEPNRYPNGFALTSLAVNGSGVPAYSLEGNLLQFDLPAPATSGSVVEITLQYTLQLPAIPPPSDLYKPQPYGYTARQLNLVDWYPFVPPLDGQGNWLVHPPHVFGETLVYPAADFEVQLTVNGNSTPLIVAASGAGKRAENQYAYSLARVRNFALSISPDYQVLEKEVAGTMIRAYGFSDDSLSPNQAVLEYAAQAFAWYSELYGPLPRQTVSIVQADFLDGMEYDGLYFVSKGFYNLYNGSVNGYLSLITVHEMAHQWWYGLVGSDQAQASWLDEGLSTFAELQYLERYYPDQASWWWAYRVDYYQPEGFIDLPVYDYVYYTGYRNAVYLRSTHFLAELREAVGADAYNAAIRSYVQAAAGGVATSSNFWLAFSGLAGYPFTEITSTYFQNPP